MMELKSQQSFSTQWNSQAKATTEALLWVSHSIIKHKKSLQDDGEMMKEAFVEAADSLLDESTDTSDTAQRSY